MVSSGISWNVPRVTCIFPVHSQACRRVCIPRNTSDKWDISCYDWELRNSRIWLTETDINPGFPHLNRYLDRFQFVLKEQETKIQKCSPFSFIFFSITYGSAKKPVDKQNACKMGEYNWPRSWCVQSVLTISVKILPYRPPARLIRAKYTTRQRAWHNSICLAGTNNFLRKNLSHEILHSKFIYGTIFVKSVIKFRNLWIYLYYWQWYIFISFIVNNYFKFMYLHFN